MRTGLILSNPFGTEPLLVNTATNTTQAASLTKKTELRSTSTGMLMVHPNSLETVSNQKQVFQNPPLLCWYLLYKEFRDLLWETPQRQGTFRWLFRSQLAGYQCGAVELFNMLLPRVWSRRKGC